MNAVFTTPHGTVQLPPMDARITPPPEELNVAIPKLQTCPILPPLPHSLPDTPHRNTSSVFSTSPRKSTRRRSSSSRGRPSRGDLSQQPHTNSRLIFEPRPFEILYIDRAYLADILQQQAGRAAELMRQYCVVEFQLQNLVGDSGRRKLRKKLSLLKSRVNQAAEQQKRIFSRLGELYVEIQSRENLAQTWTIDSPSVVSPLCFSPLSCSFHAPDTPLSGTSEHFAPMGYFGDAQQFYEPSYLRQDLISYGLETVDEAGENLLCGPDSVCESVESETTPVTPTDVEDPFVEEKDYGSETGQELGEGRSVAVRERRLSLPSIHNAWPEV